MIKHRQSDGSRRASRLLVFASGAALIASTAAAANAPPEDARSNATTIDTVVVTATKRRENIQNVPFSINAFSGAQLETRKIENFDDLAKAAPGITFQEAFEPRNISGISMRGTSVASDSVAVDQGVAVYIDDVPAIGASESREQLFDLQDVEVLRGPQGTLFGRNVTGGAISLHTSAPSFTPEAKALVEYGSFNSWRADALVTGPLDAADTLAGKLVVAARSTDGWMNDPYLPGRHFSADRDYLGRLQLLYQPNDQFRALLGVSVYSDSGDAETIQHYGNVQPNIVAGYPPLHYNPNDTDTAITGSGSERNFSADLRIDDTLSFGTLTAITGYRQTAPQDTNAPVLGIPAPLPTYGFLTESDSESNRQPSEEIRLASKADQRLRWIAGIFLLDSDRSQNKVFTASPSYPAYSSSNANLQSYAAFGELSYDILPNLTATVGGRYSWEMRSGSNSVSSAVIYGPPIGTEETGPFSGTFQAFTPKATLTYKITHNIMVYATVDKGFKSGGFDNSVVLPNAKSPTGFYTPPFPEEIAWNYEIGGKATWLDDRLVTNISIYREDYTNIQRTNFSYVCFCETVYPIPKAYIQGFDADIILKPVRWLTLGGTWNYQDDQAQIPVQNPGPPITTTLVPTQLDFTPKNAFNVYADGDWPVGDFGTVSVGGDVTFRSTLAFATTNVPDAPELHAKSAENGVVNLHASLSSRNNAWKLTVWGRNVSNVRYIEVASAGSPLFLSSPAAGQYIDPVAWNPPAMYGVTLTYDWR